MEEITKRLLAHAPAGVDLDRKITIRIVAVKQVGAMLGNVAIPPEVAEEGEDVIAYAVAYAILSGVFEHVFKNVSAYMRKTTPLVEKAPHRLLKEGLGAIQISASIPAAFTKLVLEIGEVEAASISAAVDWVHRAGYAPEAAIRFFELGFGRKIHEGPPKNPVAKVLKVAFTPLEFAIDLGRRGRKPFESDEERMAFVKAAVQGTKDAIILDGSPQ